MSWVWTASLNGGLCAAGYLAARDGLRQPRGLTLGLATAVLSWSWLTLGLELLGSFGFLARGPLLGWVLAGLGAAWAVGRLRGRSPRREAGEVHQPWGWEGVVSLGLVLWVAAALGATSLALPVKVVSDGPIYHLYFAVRWWKSQRLDLIATPFGENAATYFPAVGDLWFTWLIVCHGGELLAKVGQAPFLVLAGMSAFALCRRLGGSGRSSMVAVCWFLSSAPLLLFSFEPNVDTIFVAGELLGVLFLLRYLTGDDGLASLWLSGLAFGCAMGTKVVGVVFVPPLILAGVVAAFWVEPSRSRKLLGAFSAVAAPSVVSGFWFARNAWLTGNPLYPLHLRLFGRVWLAGWYGPEVMPMSQYYLPLSDWRSFLDTMLAVLDARLAPLWLAAVAGAWAFWANKRPRVDGWVWAASGLAILNVALYWLVIPYRTQQRFMLQALGLAAIPLARLFDRLRWLPALGALLLAVHMITPQGWLFTDPGREPPWDLSPVVPNAVPGLLPLPHEPSTILVTLSNPGARIALLAATALGLVAMASAWSWARFARYRKMTSLGIALVATTLLVSFHVLAVHPWDGDARTAFLARFPDYFRGWIETDRRAGPAGARIAYAGTNLPYYLFGPGLRNEVRSINVDAHRGWLLHDYHREASARANEPVTWNHPRPGWDRMRPDYQAWLANLHAEGIDLLVVARANPVEGPHNVADAEGFPIERVWADAHPEAFTLLYGPESGDPLYRLYRVNPPASARPRDP
ncbi:MAG: ArnT family glycosyltransferase [Isosphaeraceae bacterium]